MKITIESTERIVELDGRNGATMPARVWQGRTNTGVDVLVFVTRIAALADADLSQFEAELQQHGVPRADVQAWPARMLID